MSNNEAFGGFHAPIVDELLERKGVDEFVYTQNESTPGHLESHEEQVVSTPNRSMASTEGRCLEK